MAPIKQEEFMKDALDKRSINPSSDSWAKLSSRLDVEESNTKNSVWWRFAIAASIVGIALVATVFFNNQPIMNNTPTTVDSKQSSDKVNGIEISEMPIESNKVVVEENDAFNKASNKTELESEDKTKKTSEKPLQHKLLQNNVVAQLENPTKENAAEKAIEIKKSTLTFEEQKIQDVVAQIQELKQNGNVVSDMEIENLLIKAQKEILSNNLFNDKTRTVDANALLQDVEDDLQQSFRSKVFETLQSGYNSVKTAVAERHN